ncbi:purine-cytosine permease-like protein [Pseudomonas sp. S30_BP2TU TE3576]|jgi:NCS1 family nucleobase:cation symporter-1
MCRRLREQARSHRDFIGHFVDLVLALLVVLVPWTAINLIDFYAIHKGD